MGNSQQGFSDLDAYITQINLENSSKRMYAFKPFVFKKCQTVKSESKPKPRSGHRIVCNDGDLYCYGGYNPNIRSTGFDLDMDDGWLLSKPLFREMWRFNFATREWIKLKVRNMPFVLASNAVLLEGKLLMVYGGTGMPFGGHSSNTLYTCNLSEGTLTFRKVKVSGQVPEPRYGQAVFRTDNYLYVIGGTTGYQYSADVHRLNLLSNVWDGISVSKGLPNEPLGRYRHELCLLGTKVYVLGGGTSLESFGFEELPVYDYQKNEWCSVATHGDKDSIEPYPKPRRFHSADRIPDSYSLIIVGGFSGSEILDDCWLLDLQGLTWKKLSSLKLQFPTYFHASCITPSGKLYTFGGICEVGRRTHRTSNIVSAWVCIPKLKEMCWEAVLYYGLFKNSQEMDLKMELPLEFQNRFH